jgi:RNA polymerase sigma-70 factor (ECF subfamily)
MADADDRALVDRCLTGDAEAFGLLVDRYQNVVYNVALRMLGNPEDAWDVAQVTFVKAFEKLHTYKAEYKFFSWIYRIMMNESLNTLQRRKPQVEIDPSLAAPGGTPEDDLDTKEMSEHVQWAVIQLPLDYRRLIVLRHFGNLSYREIARALAIPEKTVKSRLFTARRMLRDILLERGTVQA